MGCPLCEMRKRTEWLLVVCRCATHKDKWMLVYGRHVADPGQGVEEQMRRIAETLFPGRAFRGPASILDHWHLHEE